MTLFKKKCNSIEHTGCRERGFAAAGESPIKDSWSGAGQLLIHPIKNDHGPSPSHTEILIGSPNREEKRKILANLISLTFPIYLSGDGFRPIVQKVLLALCSGQCQ